MAGYRVLFKESVWKDFNSVPKKDLKKILKRIEQLSENPRPSGCEKLTGKDRYRLRQGRYRIIYSIQDDELTVWIVKVGHRKDVYRWSEPITWAELVTSSAQFRCYVDKGYEAIHFIQYHRVGSAQYRSREWSIFSESTRTMGQADKRRRCSQPSQSLRFVISKRTTVRRRYG